MAVKRARYSRNNISPRVHARVHEGVATILTEYWKKIRYTLRRFLQCSYIQLISDINVVFTRNNIWRWSARYQRVTQKLRCNAVRFYNIVSLTVSVSTNCTTLLFPKCISHCNSHRDELRNAAVRRNHKIIVAQNCNSAFCWPYLPRLRQIGLRYPGVRRRCHNYNISADTCARLTAQLPASERFSDERRHGAPISIDLSSRSNGSWNFRGGALF